MNKEEKIQELLNDYLEGNLNVEEQKELLEVLNDPEARKELALVAVVSRLLKSVKSEPVSSKRVLDALPKADMKKAKELKKEKDQNTRKPKKLKKKKQTPKSAQIKETKKKAWNKAQSGYDKSSLPSTIAAVVICTMVAVGAWWGYKNYEPIEKTAQKKTKPTVVKPPKPENTAKPPRSQHEPLKYINPQKRPSAPDQHIQPDVNKVASLPVPKGDGSDHKGFVPPPTDLKKYEPKSDDKPQFKLSELGVKPPSKTVKKSAPRSRVLITKLKRGMQLQWDATPNDVDNLLAELKDLMGLKYRSATSTLSEIDSDPSKTPIIYFSTHYAFSFNKEERIKLRKFMLKGGMVIFNTGLGSQPAYESAVRELRCIFPESAPQPLNTDHPVFHSYFNIKRVRYCTRMKGSLLANTTPQLEGVTLNCRTLSVISRFGMGIGWEGVEKDDYKAYVIEDARKLGINILSYAMAQKAWSAKAMAASGFKGTKEASPGQMHMAQIIYDGEWKTRTAGLSMLLHSFNRKTDVDVKLAIKDMRLTDPGLFNVPLLYITGHEDFYLSRKEAKLLRDYLEKGGFLFAESCCGRSGFDSAFRAEMKRILPKQELGHIPSSSSVFSLPNKLEETGVTPSLSAKLGSTIAMPRLEGIQMDGNYVVIYSKYALAGGWEGSQNPYANGYNNIGSIKLGQNILLYAITH